MCHLCRKARALQSLDSKAFKPLGQAISGLHRNVKPHLGDLWTWRYNATGRLRSVLEGLQKVLPVPALNEMIKEVDDELLHCEKQMVEHPARNEEACVNSGSSAGSDSYITPSESVSVMARKRRELEAAAETLNYNKTCQKAEEQMDLPHYHLSGSDLDPPAAFIKKSCMIVEAWLEDCDAVAAGRQEKDADGVSVSSVPGGFHERPRPDVGLWEKPLRIRKFPNRESQGASFTPRGSDYSPPHYHKSTNTAPSTNNASLALDALVTDKMPRNTSPKRKVKFIEKLFSALHPKKPENAVEEQGKQRRVRFKDPTSPQKHRAKREKAKLKERDSATEKRVSHTLTISHQDTNSHQSSNIGASSASMSSKGTRIRVHQEIEGRESNSSVLSSRASVINFGSIMGEPASPRSSHLSYISLLRPQEPQDFHPSPPKPISCWQSDSRSQSRNSTSAQTSRGTGPSSSTSRQFETLPPSFKSIVPPNLAGYKLGETDFDKNRARRRAERNEAMPAGPPKTPKSAVRRGSDRDLASPVAEELRARRAERAPRTPGIEKYHRDDRERLWSSQKA